MLDPILLEWWIDYLLGYLPNILCCNRCDLKLMHYILLTSKFNHKIITLNFDLSCRRDSNARSATRSTGTMSLAVGSDPNRKGIWDSLVESRDLRIEVRQ
jgi:hypothetical protein